MSDILSNIGNMIGYVWGLMANEIVPGLTFREIFIYFWILAICVQLVVNLGIGFFFGENNDDSWINR